MIQTILGTLAPIVVTMLLGFTAAWRGRADEGACREIKDAVRSLETIQVADLMEPLRRVKAPMRHNTGAARPAAQKEQLR
jgi:hypothetical protein